MSYTAVTTVYNNEDEIVDYLDNMLCQTMPPDQIIIADGGSSDNTSRIVDHYAKNSQCIIKLIYGKRLNIAEGFNEAIRKADNSIIAITAIGNRYKSDYFEILYNMMVNYNYDICYGAVRGTKKNTFQVTYANTFLNGDRGECLPIGSNHGVLIKKSIIEITGYFYEKFYYAGEDTEFYQRANDMGAISKCIEEAYMEWDTPKDIIGFIKQIKYYTIARMQIEENRALIGEYIKVSSPIWTLVITLIFFRKWLLYAVVIIISMHILKAIKLKHDGKYFSLWCLKRYSQIFFEIKYCKFILKKFKVHREAEE